VVGWGGGCLGIAGEVGEGGVSSGVWGGGCARVSVCVEEEAPGETELTVIFGRMI
jgi:hypothetical protein